MKVIIAGLPKTGTKSTVAALQDMGMNVYDYMDHFDYHGSYWFRICNRGATTEDFRQMYENIDAIADLPVCYFWEEIHKAFPEAKIILSVRDNEDIWCESMVYQLKTFFSSIQVVMKVCSPTFQKFFEFSAITFMPAHKLIPNYGLKLGPINEDALKKSYRMHNTYVMKAAPKDKLLVFNVKEGWEPLCKFLGVDVPSKPFPHRNVRGSITKELAETHPTFVRMKREMVVSFGAIVIGLSFGTYIVVKSWLTSRSLLSKATALLLWKLTFDT